MIIQALVMLMLAALGVCFSLIIFDVIILALDDLTNWCENLKQNLKKERKNG